MKIVRAPGHFPWERLIVCIIAGVAVWAFMDTHRRWVWAYFDSLMLIKDPSPAVAAVAEKAVSAITTIAISGMSAITAISIFFITGNASILQNMFRFSSIGNAAGSVSDVSQSITERRDSTETNTNINIDAEFCTPELTERYADK